jgi:hypothetical protein
MVLDAKELKAHLDAPFQLDAYAGPFKRGHSLPCTHNPSQAVSRPGSPSTLRTGEV